MTLVGIPCVGIVYKTTKGTTYVEWWHTRAVNPYFITLEKWIEDRFYWDSVYTGKHRDRIMCVVRAK
jgi:hypothetical protein